MSQVQKRGKWIRRFVKIALVLVGLSGAIAFIKASNVSQTNHKLIAKMKTYDDKLEVQKRGKWIRRFVKIALVLVGLSGAVAFIKASNVSQTNHKLIAKMKTYDDKLGFLRG